MTLSVNIPFAGFYGTKWADIIDSAETRDLEHFEGEAQSDPDHDLYQPEPAARLDARELEDILWHHANYGIGYAAIARDYAAGLDYELSERLGFKQRFVFEEMTSPREYNFETDRLFVAVPIETVKAWVAISRRADRHATLAKAFKDRFTSCSGFSSFYDNTIPRKPVDEWDHNELGTLLRAVIDLKCRDQHDEDGLEWSIYYPMTDADYEYWEKCLDWPAFCAAAKEAQDDKLEELRAADPDHVAPPARCTETLDLFAERP